jgi:hypothetical protein
MDTVQTVLGVIVGALGISQYRLQKRVTRIEQERRTEELDARLRADVMALFEVRQDRGNLDFVLWNRGPAVAREVSFNMKPVGVGDLPILRGGPPLPIPALDVEQRFEFPAMTGLQFARAVDVELQWLDGAGSQTKALRLSLP